MPSRRGAPTISQIAGATRDTRVPWAVHVWHARRASTRIPTAVWHAAAVPVSPCHRWRRSKRSSASVTQATRRIALPTCRGNASHASPARGKQSMAQRCAQSASEASTPTTPMHRPRQSAPFALPTPSRGAKARTKSKRARAILDSLDSMEATARRARRASIRMSTALRCAPCVLAASIPRTLPRFPRPRVVDAPTKPSRATAATCSPIAPVSTAMTAPTAPPALPACQEHTRT
mmetsp:Transcript_99364/g.160203  ORF Transcript_99364/g.160203 Transcript_99364/m.160203 type:complete len:234 (-) Transcript_99364:2344-3045(-)